MMHKRLVAPVITASLGLVFGLATSATARDTERCATFGEYDRIHDGMTLGEVRQVFDTSGKYRDAGPDTFAYGFRSCSEETRFVIRFYSGNGLVIGKHTSDID